MSELFAKKDDKKKVIKKLVKHAEDFDSVEKETRQLQDIADHYRAFMFRQVSLIYNNDISGLGLVYK